MEYINLKMPFNNSKLEKGKLLIAEPFLADPNFYRTVIFICEHNEDGTIGFILNQSTKYSLADLISSFKDSDLKIYKGGPVQEDTLQLLHRLPEKIGGTEILPGIYWGGSFEALQEILFSKEFLEEDIRLFIGYSGWTAGQLDKEIKEKTWFIADAPQKLVFAKNITETWKNAIKLFGKDYSYLYNIPHNPQFN